MKPSIRKIRQRELALAKDLQRLAKDDLWCEYVGRHLMNVGAEYFKRPKGSALKIPFMTNQGMYTISIERNI